MPYCSGCGSRYQEGDKVCKSCGFELLASFETQQTGKASTPAVKKARTTPMTKKTTRKKKTVSDPKPELVGEKSKQLHQKDSVTHQEVVTGLPDVPEKRQLQSEVITMPSASFDDIHLGKGIIKPKAVEVGLDGYHFKYEEQPHLPKRGDTFNKERIGAELRVVNPDFDQAAVDSGQSGDVAKTAELKVERPASPPQLDQEPPQPATIEQSKAPDSLAAVEDPFDTTIETELRNSLEAEMRDLVSLLEESETDPTLELAGIEDQASDSAETVNSPLETTAETKPAITTGAVPESPGGDTEVKGQTDPNQVAPIETPVEAGPAEKTAEPLVTPQRAEVIEAPAVADLSEISITDPTPGPVEAVNTEASEGPELPAENVKPQPAETLFEKEPAKVIWQGHQSWFGIPLPNHICLSDRRLILTEQNGHIVEVELSKIKHIGVKQSWLAKLLGIGDLIIDLRQQVPSRHILTGVSNPVKLRALLEDLVKKAV